MKYVRTLRWRWACLGVVIAAGTLPLLANPTGGSVAAGSAGISGEGTSAVTIKQGSNLAIINWQTFSIASGESTTFLQPSVTSAALNRVLGGQTSIINGTLTANGQIYLINGNGIIVGPGGVINAGAFTASTRDISDADFLAGDLQFIGSNNAGVENFGTINALGGNVVLIGKTVDNEGTINAPNGTAGLIAADNVLLAQKNADGSTITVSPDPLATSDTGAVGVKNGGTITAAAAELKAANGNIYALAIQNEGTIRATTVQKQGGHIWLTSDSGAIVNSGTLDASATVAGGQGGTITMKDMGGTTVNTASGQILATGGAGGTGGTIETSGQSVQVDGTVNAGAGGNWLLDPVNLTIDSGAATTIDTALDNGTSVTELTTATGASGSGTQSAGEGDIDVDSAISWTTAASLTLSAYANVNVNANIASSGGGAVTLQADNTGTGNGTVTFNAATVSTIGPVTIFYNPTNPGGTTPGTVNATEYTTPTDYTGDVTGGGSLTAYMLVNNVDDLQNAQNNLSGDYALGGNIDASATATWNSDAGFVPIGNDTTAYTGTFNGAGYTISNLTIDLPEGTYVGLFGYTGSGSVLENVGLVNDSVTGGVGVGGLVGYNDDGTVETSYATGAVSGNGGVGGLVGYNDDGTVEMSYATGTVTGGGGNEVGGLVGENADGATVEASYATGAVSAPGSSNVGGLVGYNIRGALVETSYATGTVSASGGTGVGGLVGDTTSDSTVETSYATGAVSAPGGTGVGGLVGSSEGGTVETSYWAQDTDLNVGLAGIGSDPGDTTDAKAETLSALMQQSTFTPTGASPGAWDFTDTWIIVDGVTTPLLRALSVTISGTTPGTGDPVDLISQGNVVYTTTADGGTYSFLVPDNVVTSGALLTDVDASPTLASTYYVAGALPAAPITGVNLADNLLSLDGTGLVSNTALGNAAGSLSTATYGINYSVDAGTLALTTAPGVSLSIDANDVIDGNVTANGTLTTTAAGVLTVGGDYILTSSGATTINAAVNGNGSAGSLVLDAPTLNLNAAITLNAGSTLSGNAATVNVGASGLIQNGVDAAASGATVNLADTTYTLTGDEVLIAKSLTLNGNGAVLNANDASRVMEIDGTASGDTVTLDNLTLENGDGAEGGTTGAAGSSLDGVGGGLLVYTTSGLIATVTINDSTISGNSIGVNGSGGGIFNEGYNGTVTLTINDSTISGNSVGDNGSGGGILNDGAYGTATLTINDSTITGNSAGYDGGGIYNYGFLGTATLTIGNTILAGNTVGGAESDYAKDDGTLIDNGYNLFGNDGVLSSNETNDVMIAALGTSGDISSVLAGTESGSSATLVFTPDLADNGGPTETIALIAGSPAIAAGGPNVGGYELDQRGYARSTTGDISIGAYEYDSAGDPFIVTTTTDPLSSDYLFGSLRTALNYANANPSLDPTITFDSSDFTGGAANTITLSGSELLIDSSLTLDASAVGGVTIDAAGNSRVLEIDGTASGVTVTLDNLTLENGNGVGTEESGSGGGLLVYAESGDTATVTINDSTISGNSVGVNGMGGGIYNFSDEGTATLTINDSTISGNSAVGDDGAGGGIFNYGYKGTAALTINNSTITGNSAGGNGYGGGIYNTSYDGPATLTIGDTILAGNTANGAESDYASDDGTLTDNGYNLFGTSGVLTGNGTTDVMIAALGNAGDITSVLAGTESDGFFTPDLADNGGPTETIALVVGSAAYLAGGPQNGVTTDQRGVARGSTISIGAFDGPESDLDVDISGTTPGADDALDFISDGVLLPYTTSASGNVYSIYLPENDVTAGLLVTDVTGSPSAASYYLAATAPTAPITGLNLADSLLDVLGTGQVSNTVLGTAAGSLDPATYGINYSVDSGTLALTTASGVSLTINMPYTMDGDLNVGGTLTLNTSTPVSALHNLTAAGFILETGAWEQIVNDGSNGGNITGSLPSFVDSGDFELQTVVCIFERFAGGDGTTGDPYQIVDVYGLQGLGSLSGNLLGDSFVLNNDIDATATANWNPQTGAPDYNAGFVPIGNSSTPYTGTFNGAGYTISNLTIDLPVGTDVGLFAETGLGSILENVGLVNDSVIGADAVGGLVGVTATGGTVEASYATGTVSGSVEVGGLVGLNGVGGTVETSYATGAASGNIDVGGLVGSNDGTVETSYATGAVTGSGVIGVIGGLVGLNNEAGTVETSYATGAVTGGSGNHDIGGLVGENERSTVETSYATGVVSAPGDTDVGGLVGDNVGDGTVENGYWAQAGFDSGLNAGLYGIGSSSSNAGATPLTLAQMMVQSNFTPAGTGVPNWDFTDTWTTLGNTTTPLLLGDYVTISGTTPGATDAVDLISQGSVTAMTTASGNSYSFYEPLSVFVDGALVTDVTGSPGASTYYVGGASGAITGVNLADSLLNLDGTGLASNTALGTAAGSLSTATYGINYSVNSGTLALTTASGIGVTINSPYTMDGDLNVGGTLILNTGTTVSALHNVTAAGFILLSGTWEQIVNSGGNGGNITGSLPTFSVTSDFELQGGTFERFAGGEGTAFDPYQITDVYGLQGVASTSLLADSFILNNDIDASATANWNPQSGPSPYNAGFVTIGNETTAYTGTFNGAGYTISNLTIDLPVGMNVGLFAETGLGSVLENVGLVNDSITGNDYVGGLVGLNNSGTVETSYATGTVSGSEYVGGLVGYNDGTVEMSYATGAVTGGDDVGGLVGNNDGGTVEMSYATGAVTGDSDGGGIGGLVGLNNIGTVEMSYATGAVTDGGDDVGGLVGDNQEGGMVEMSYATGTVTGDSGSEDIGGLVGYNSGSTVEMSYATGVVSGNENVGGLVGENIRGTVETSYATGAVSGDTAVGGLVGELVGNNAAGTVETSYSTGAVSGNGNVGGLVGLHEGGTVETSYWAQDTDLNVGLYGIGSASSNTGATPETLTNLALESTYDTNPADTGYWDFTLGTGVWGIGGYTSTGLINNGLPYFQWQYPTIQLTASDQTTTYNNTNTGDGFSESAYTVAGLGGGSLSTYITGSPLLTVSGVNVDVGTQNTIVISATPASPDDAVEYVNGTESFSARSITVSVNPGGTSQYGLTPTDPGIALTGGTLANGDSLSGLGLGDDLDSTLTSASDAGTYTINVTGYSGLTNYTVTPVSADYIISKAALTVAVNSGGTSQYGLTPTDPGIGVTGGTLYNGDTLSGLGLGDDLDSTLTSASDAGTYTINVTGYSGLTNYTVTPVSADYVISKAALTVAVNSGGTSQYGLTPTDPGIGVTGGTLYNGDTLSSLGLGDDLDSTLTSASDAGTYTINVTGYSGLTNYTVIPVSADYIISKAALTVAVNSGGTSQYGLTPTDPGIGVTGGTLYNGDTLSGLGLGDDLDSTLTSASDAGTYTINVTGYSGLTNYTVTPVSADYVISKAALTVAVNSGGTSQYGLTPTDPGIGVTGGTLYNGDTLSGLGLGDDLDSTLTSASDAGTYTINVTGYSGLTNYTVTPVSADYVISKAALTVAVNSGGTSQYGLTPTDPGIGVTGGTLYNGDTLSGLGLGDDLDSTLTSASDAGTYTINVTGYSGLTNYTVTPVSADYVISKAALTVAVNSGGTSQYGLTPTDPGIGVTGGTLYNGDTLSSLGLGDDLDSTLTSASDAGTYTINVTGYSGLTNYTVIPVSADYIISKATLTVAVNSGGTSQYGLTPTDPGIGVTGGTLYNGDTLSGLGLGDDLDSTLTSASDAGTYTINVTGYSGLTNYTVTPVSADYVISKATLTYVANPATRYVGVANPVFTGTVTGFLNGDSLTSGATTGTLLFTSPANASSLAGQYAIDGSGLTAENYNFVQADSNATALTVAGFPSGQPFTPFFDFSAQFNANANYNSFFTQAWFPLFNAGWNNWLVPVFSPGNEPHPVYSTHGAEYAEQGKTPGGVIAFGSSFQYMKQGGTH